eukprot:1036061-Pleurochrysis_carterae.AAC.2
MRKAVSCTPRRGGGRRKLSLCLPVRVALLSAETARRTGAACRAQYAAHGTWAEPARALR